MVKMASILKGNEKIIDAMTDALKNAGGYVSKNWGKQGFSGVYNNMTEHNQDIGKAVKNAYTHEGGKLNMGAVAGSYLGASAGYRALSGGGVYRDKNGNANIIGIPFV
jgi:hypothetical protein